MAVKPPEDPTAVTTGTTPRPRLRLLPLAGLALLLVGVVFQLARTGRNQRVQPDPGEAGGDTATVVASGGDPSGMPPDTGAATGIPQGGPTTPTRQDRDAGVTTRPQTTPATTTATPGGPTSRQQTGPGRQTTRSAAADSQARARVDTPAVRRLPDPVREPPPRTVPVFRRESADSIAGLLVAIQVRAERREYPQAFEALRTARTRVDALLATFPAEATLRSLDRQVRVRADSVRMACEAWREIQMQRGSEAPVCR